MIKQIIFSKSGGGFVFLMEDLVIKQGHLRQVQYQVLHNV